MRPQAAAVLLCQAKAGEHLQAPVERQDRQSRASLVQGRRVKHLVKAQAFLMGTAEACLESLSVLVLEPEPLTVMPNSIFSQGRSSTAEGGGQIGAAQLGYHFALLQLCTLALLKEWPHTSCTWPQGL